MKARGYAESYFFSVAKIAAQLPNIKNPGESARCAAILNRAYIAYRNLTSLDDIANEYAIKAGENADDLLKKMITELLKIEYIKKVTKSESVLAVKGSC